MTAQTLLPVIAWLLLTSCQAKQPIPLKLAPIEIPDDSFCGAMCRHLGPKTPDTPDALNCEEGGPVYNSDLPGPVGLPNQSCRDFCLSTQSNGVFLNPRCLMKVPSCDLIEEWRTKSCTD